MKKKHIVAVTVFGLLFFGSGVEAQKRQEHSYFWLSFGMGAGANFSQGLDDEGNLGGAGYIRVGAALTQQVLIGVEFLAWVRRLEAVTEGDPPTIQRTNPSILLMYYPSNRGGLFLKAGLSAAYVDIKDSGMWVTERGTGARAGLGYDIGLGHLYITPNLDWMYQTVEPTVGAKTTHHMLLATIGITWH